jgi:[acyl-carrier-protein] S-malonyltransferase
MLARPVAQVTAPVRWDLVMHTLGDLGVSGVIELPPAGTLAGLVKRELKGNGAPEIVTLNTPDDLKAARDLIARHGMAPSHEPTMAFVLAVATVGGTFEPLPHIEEGSPINAGQVLGHIITRQGEAEVAAHDSGHLTEWLAHPNDPVNPAQPLARIGRASVSASERSSVERRRVANERTTYDRVAHHQPRRTGRPGSLTNDDLAQMVDTNDA